ncbi:MAG: hypothetical protein ABFQ62_03665 [Patescibacteria group bacterium]
MLTISFSNDIKTKKFIAGLFGNKTDKENYVIGSKGDRVIDSDGQEILINDLGLIKKGSEIYVRDNIISMVSFYRNFINK